MHFGIEIVPFGYFANPRTVMEFAQAAERSGWEGLMVWDHLLFPYDVGDPWVLLTAAAAVTRQIKLITGVAPIPRYRLHLLGRTLASLDILSAGRVILGVGAGAIHNEFSAFGEPGDYKTRAAMLDEGLDALTCLLSGETVHHQGQYYQIEDVALHPIPVQKPRIPIWVGGDAKRALRRAARWDGYVVGTIDEQLNITLQPEQLAERVAYIRQHRTAEAPMDICITGATQPGDAALPQAYQQAGATWWCESLFGSRGSQADMMRRLLAGPPKIPC